MATQASTDHPIHELIAKQWSPCGFADRPVARPDLMRLAFGGIMPATAVIFLLYNWFVLPKHAADTLTPGNDQ